MIILARGAGATHTFGMDATMKLKGKTAIITGAGGYLGRGIALRLGEEGARVMVNDKNLEEARSTVNSIVNKGGYAKAHGADVTKTEQVQEMTDEVIKAWGQIDILVNNAGDFRDALLTKMRDGRLGFCN